MTQLPFRWNKMGRLITPGDDGWTHASHPCALHLHDDTFLLAFARRDQNQHSHIFTCMANFDAGEVSIVTDPRHAVSPGPIGYFDCDGAIPTCFVSVQNQRYLFYVGWQNLPGQMWQCDTGRLKVGADSATITREFDGPVLGRDKDNPLFAAATTFHIDDQGVWHSLYNSGISWERLDHPGSNAKAVKHFYGLFYANSQDGTNWICDRRSMALPFRDEFEYAFGRPSVLHREGIFHLWFSSRARPGIDAYRMGYATSNDFKTWKRNDDAAGLDVSNDPDDWDHDMICYPSVHHHKSHLYMLYNGNGYGKTGFGYASVELDGNG